MSSSYSQALNISVVPEVYPFNRRVATPEGIKVIPIALGVRRYRDGAILPTRGSDLASGYDLYAHCLGESATVYHIQPATGSSDSEIHSLHKPFYYKEESGDSEETFTDTVGIAPRSMKVVKTGLNVRIPIGYEVQVRPRSGLAAKKMISITNTPGTIDADYDGDGDEYEVRIMVENRGTDPFLIKHGDRIAQMVLCPLPLWTVEEVTGDNLTRHGSNRAGGLGSTGKS